MAAILNKIFPRTNVTRILFFLFSDVIFIVISVILAFLLRFDGAIPGQYPPVIQKVIILALIFLLPIFYFSKLYSFSWSYVSTNELISLFKALSIGFLFLGLTIYISKDFPFFLGFPRSILFISFVLIFIFCGGIRFAKKIYQKVFNREINGKAKEKTLIVGAGDAGEQILRSILAARSAFYSPVGFVDDNPLKQGVLIHGLKVLGKISDMPKVAKKFQIGEAIIALPTASSEVIKTAVEFSRKAEIKKIKIVPSINEIIDGKVSLRDVREVEPEDLLERQPVSLNSGSIGDFICDKTILITGAAGSIGSELCRQVAKFCPSLLLLLDCDETGIFNISEELKHKFPHLKSANLVANIQDKEKMEKIFSVFRPNIVFHAAAYKHVPLMEECPEEAVKNNIFGTRIVGELAVKCGTEKFIFISTDKAINPTSVMGATKRMAEMVCQALNKVNCTKFVSVRFGNVLDSRGSVVRIFRDQIKKGGPVEVTHPEMKRYFMTNPEACLLVMQAGAMGKGGEVFVLDMGKPIKILDLAKEMIRFSGLEPDKDIPIIFIGIRPGEKLFEEILTAEEGTIATKNQKIFIAKLFEIDEPKLKEGLENLKSAVSNADGRKENIKLELKKIVLLYNPAETK